MAGWAVTRAEVLAEAARACWRRHVGRLCVEVRTLGAWVEDRYEPDLTWQVSVDTRACEASESGAQFVEVAEVLRELEALGIVDGAEVGP